MQRQGVLIVVSGPSGAGKGTVLDKLKSINKQILFSISVTTRSPRDGEVDGKNYFFRTREQFQEMLDNNELLEWVEYCTNLYGTPKKYIEDTIKSGKDLILEIDVEGALKVRETFPDCVLIFIMPPSFKELERRIVNRGTESEESIEKRLLQARKEIDCAMEYDYVILNKEVTKAANDIEFILLAEGMKVSRNKDLIESIINS
jgi:guanylate kinase